MGLKISEILPIGERILAEAGVENSQIDAEVLLCFETGLDRKRIFLGWDREIDETQCKRYFALLERRVTGEPLQYITGEQYFMGHRFCVNPAVLIPRPETEILAEKAISYLDSRKDAETVLDLCTGSGVLAVSIAKACPFIRVTATDISDEALAVAEQNACELGVPDRVGFIKSDLFKSIAQKFDLIVTNPPYIRTGDIAGLQREIRSHEPLSALDGGADGLDFYRRIAADAPAYLRRGGRILAEIGHDQAPAAAAIFEGSGFRTIDVIKDLAGFDRILSIEQFNY